MLVIVWVLHLYGKITSVSYCTGCTTVQVANKGLLLYGWCCYAVLC